MSLGTGTARVLRGSERRTSPLSGIEVIALWHPDDRVEARQHCVCTHEVYSRPPIRSVQAIAIPVPASRPRPRFAWSVHLAVARPSLAAILGGATRHDGDAIRPRDRGAWASFAEVSSGPSPLRADSIVLACSALDQRVRRVRSLARMPPGPRAESSSPRRRSTTQTLVF